MNEKITTLISMLLVVAIALLLVFPFLPAVASDAETSGKKTSASQATTIEEEKAETVKQAVTAEEKAAESNKAAVEKKAATETKAAAEEKVAVEEKTAAGAGFEAAGHPTEPEEPWEVTSLDISKDIDVVTAPGVEISLEKTASESYIEMMLGETKEVTFTIEVDAELSDSYFIAGNIFVQNTGEWAADVIAVSDTVWYKAGGPDWLAATSNITTTVPLGDNAIPTGGPHVYSYSGTFTLPVPLASVTSMSNLIEITISNKPDPPKPGMQDWKFHYREDFAKPVDGASTLVSLEDIETISPEAGLSYEITSVTINGADAASLTGPWELDLADAPFTVVIEKDLTAEEAGTYQLNNKPRNGELEDEVEVEIVVEEPEKITGSISGYKYVDLDADGELDEGESGLAGVTIKLYRVVNPVEVMAIGSQLSMLMFVAETVTDENGHFEFLDLDAGEYVVEEVVPEGYFPTSPDYRSIWVVEGQEASTYFLNARMARVSGEKIDAISEEPIAGVEFVLEGEDFYMKVLSGENGEFDFGWLMPGEYHLHETVPEGWVAVGASEHELTLESGDAEHFVFANQRLSAIYGFKWLDANGDGLHQGNETALEGVNIVLDGEGVHEEVLTDASGYFIFEGLLDGEYVVREEVPEGYYATSAVEVGVILEAGDEKRVDFLNAPFASVAGTKWLDLNANGEVDEGEEGLAGVTINLRDAGGDIIATAVSSSDGSYAFEGLKAGKYTVEEVLSDGYVATSPISVSFRLSAGEEKLVDFFNNAIVAGEVVTPPAQTDPGQTLPVTGFEMSLLLVMVGLLILTGALIASYGVLRMRRTR